MTKKTKELLHRTYATAVEKSNDILGIIENLHELLSKATDYSTSDSSQFDSFLRGLHSSRMIRRQTFQISNLAIDMVTVIMHIIIWLNSTKNMHILGDISGRRKALETELEKLWEKPVIHDRFGIRTILSTNGSSKKNEAFLFKVSNYIIDILAQKNRKLRNEFLSWLHSTNGIDALSIQKIDFVLNLPFSVDLDLYDDYVTQPKKSGYQSLHWIIALEPFSAVLPGVEFELQFRTHAMHENACFGSASKYEEERRPETKGIFHVNDFSKVSIIGFSAYTSRDSDLDGIHFSKQIVFRRVSPTLVYLS